jgi:serralysin
MKHQFIKDMQNPSDGFFNAIGDEIDSNFLASTSNGPGTPPTGVPLPPALVLSSEAVAAEAAQSGPVTVTAVTSGGITINLLYDAAAMAAPQSFRDGIQQAVSLLTAAITDKITVNIKIDYSGIGGGAGAGPDGGQFLSYSSVRADLINNATTSDTTFNALPAGSSFQGQSIVAVWNAQLKLYGLIGANDTTTDDGSATFATDIPQNLLVGVALHELTHALGRVPYGPQPDVFDLFRFTSAGTHLLSGSNTAPAAYFSVDGGTTKLADYGRNSDPSDFLNSGVQGSNDPFDEFYSGSTSQTLTAMDLRQLDAIGFHTMVPAQQSIVVAAAASQAVQGGAAVTLLSGPPVITDSTSTTLSSATIKIANASGGAVAGDMLFVNGVQNGLIGNGVTASWNAATDTLTLTGSATLAVYDTLLSEISFQDTGTDSSTGSHPLRTVTWTVNDGTANLTTTSQIAIERAPVATVANSVLNSLVSVAASSLLTASDPDGDAIATYAFKDTGNGHFVLNGVVQANNQEIDVTAAQLSQLTYQSAGGVDTVQVRVNDGTLWNAWQSFTVTGPVGTVIESLGSTALVQVGNNFFLNPIAGSTGPELMYQGSPVSVGEFGAAVPIGVEAVAGGYEVAWHNPATGIYAVWSTDSNGNYTGNFYMPGPGTATAFESLEPGFHQDLNGDGVIGVPAVAGTVIESLGSTSGPVSQPPAVTIASNDTFVFGRDGGGGNGGGNADPAEHFGSSATAGQFAALFQEMPAAQPQTVVQPVSDLHDAIDAGHHAAAFGWHIV